METKKFDYKKSLEQLMKKTPSQLSLKDNLKMDIFLYWRDELGLESVTYDNYSKAMDSISRLLLDAQIFQFEVKVH